MPLRYVARQVERFFIFRVLHVDDTPHRIALGVAVGIFVAWTPTIGLQMVLTVFLAWLLRANKLVGVPFAWISNPFTLIPIYKWCNYNVGRLLLPGDYPDPNFFNRIVLTGSWAERTKAFWEETIHVFAPLWLGSVVVGLLLATPSYFTVRYAVKTYRLRRAQRRAPRQLPSK